MCLYMVFVRLGLVWRRRVYSRTTHSRPSSRLRLASTAFPPSLFALAHILRSQASSRSRLTLNLLGLSPSSFPRIAFSSAPPPMHGQ
ncbi:hypothetical protein C8Q70DRAFT_975142 [Cubamyces menziesii]|nr:hypothetical protein C8Q70DRAFT_975142 [Cubamyces menziesii]